MTDHANEIRDVLMWAQAYAPDRLAHRLIDAEESLRELLAGHAAEVEQLRHHGVELIERCDAFFRADDLLSGHADVPEFQEAQAQAHYFLRQAWCDARAAITGETTEVARGRLDFRGLLAAERERDDAKRLLEQARADAEAAKAAGETLRQRVRTAIHDEAGLPTRLSLAVAISAILNNSALAAAQEPSAKGPSMADCDCMIPYLKGAGLHSPSCSIHRWEPPAKGDDQ